MNLYKGRGIKPFSGFLLMFLQLPIILALYFIFLKGGLPVVKTDILYSFISKPETINVMFLGLVDVTKKFSYSNYSRYNAIFSHHGLDAKKKKTTKT